MPSNTEPIPVALALRLCEMAIEDCDKATVIRPLIEYLQVWVRMHSGTGVAAISREGWNYPPIAALRDHYDRTRPDWRASK